jgi:Phage integrase family
MVERRTTSNRALLWRSFVALGTLLALLRPHAARADKLYPSSIVSAANSPVAITKCDAWARDLSARWSSWALGVPIGGVEKVLGNQWLDFGVAFKNVSDQPVTALRVEMTAFDAFDATLSSAELDSTQNSFAERMNVPPGGSLDLLGVHSWHNDPTQSGLLGLRWSSIDWIRNQLSVLESLEQTRSGINFKAPKTAGSRRTVSITPLLAAILNKHRISQSKLRLKLGSAYLPLDLVVACEDGSPMSPQRLSDQFRALIAKTDVPKVRFHDLRHSHATHALRAGVHPKIVSERLGHSGVAITLDLYSHVLDGMQEDGALKVDSAIQAAIARLA